MNVRFKFKPLPLATAVTLMLVGCLPTTTTPSMLVGSTQL